VRVQASAMVANDFSTQANAEGRGATQTNARRRTAQTHADTDAAETRKETQKKTVIPRSSKKPDPIVDTKIKVLPLVIKETKTKRAWAGQPFLRREWRARLRKGHTWIVKNIVI
jgi:hypothetical protein